MSEKKSYFFIWLTGGLAILVVLCIFLVVIPFDILVYFLEILRNNCHWIVLVFIVELLLVELFCYFHNKKYSRSKDVLELLEGGINNENYRHRILFVLGIVALTSLLFLKTFAGWMETYIPGVELKWLPSTLIVGIIAAPFAYLMWLWRDQNKLREIALKENEEKRLASTRNRDIAQKSKEEKKLAIQRVENLIAKLSDTGLAETVRVHTAYQLRETLPADDEENQDIINILEVYRSIIAKEAFSETNLAKSIQDIIVGFIGLGKYKWYIFRRFNFYNFTFSDIDLSGYQFEDCNFSNSGFEKVKFRKQRGELSKAISCNFREAKFKDASFTGTDFSCSDFSKCNFPENINFNKTILHDTKFINCYLSCNFKQAKFKYTKMWGASINKTAQFDNNIKGVWYNIEKYQDYDTEIETIHTPCKYGYRSDAEANKKLKELFGEPINPMPF